jgi:L-serine dehydratase
MDFEALDEGGSVEKSWRVYSVGGGALRDDDTFEHTPAPVYPLSSMKAILDHVVKNGISFWELVEAHEGPRIREFLELVWKEMKTRGFRQLFSEVVSGSCFRGKRFRFFEE